jgi:hypothetical protein
VSVSHGGGWKLLLHTTQPDTHTAGGGLALVTSLGEVEVKEEETNKV